MKLRKLTHEEWKAEGERRFGDDEGQWRFVCPACGHVAKVDDWAARGMVRAAAFSCVGRWDEKSRDAFGEGPGPCNYAGGGLIALNPVAVTFPNGEVVRVFEFEGAGSPSPPPPHPQKGFR